MLNFITYRYSWPWQCFGFLIYNFLVYFHVLLGNTDEPTATKNSSLQTPQHDEIEEAFLRLLDESFSPHFESCAQLANVRDNIDFAETLHNFLTVRLTELASNSIWNNQLSSQQFGNQFYEEGFKFLSDLTRICLM